MVVPGEGSWLTAMPLPSIRHFSPVLFSRSSAWRMVQPLRSGITVDGSLDSFTLNGSNWARLGAGAGAGAGVGVALAVLAALPGVVPLACTGRFLSTSCLG